MRIMLAALIGCVTLGCAATASAAVAVVPLKSVGGPAPVLPKGSGVAVVTSGQVDNGTVPIVIRNATSHAVTDVKIAGTAYSGGKLVATGSDQGVEPAIVAAGGLAIAYVYFGQHSLPGGTTFKFQVSSGAPGGSFDSIDLTIKTVNYTEGKLVGIARNAAGKKASGPLRVYATCFAGSRIVVMDNGYSDVDDAPAGADAPFTLDFTSFGTRAAPKCSRILVGMSGYPF